MARESVPSEQLTIQQAANEVGCSIPTVRRWISRGQLRAYRYGPRLIRIDRRDLHRMREQVAAPTYAHVSGGDGVA